MKVALDGLLAGEETPPLGTMSLQKPKTTLTPSDLNNFDAYVIKTSRCNISMNGCKTSIFLFYVITQ